MAVISKHDPDIVKSKNGRFAIPRNDKDLNELMLTETTDEKVLNYFFKKRSLGPVSTLITFIKIISSSNEGKERDITQIF